MYTSVLAYVCVRVSVDERSLVCLHGKFYYCIIIIVQCTTSNFHSKLISISKLMYLCYGVGLVASYKVLVTMGVEGKTVFGTFCVSQNTISKLNVSFKLLQLT